MDEYTYEGFLEGKIKDEHAVTHLLEDQVSYQKIKIAKMLKDLTVLRKSQNDLKLRNKAIEQKMRQLQIQLKSSKQARNIRAKQLSQKRVKLEKETIIEPKQIFKNYLDNTFPKHRGTLKRVLKLFYVMQDLQGKQPAQKIKIYNAIFQGFVRKALDWLFPKASQSVKNKSIAENLLKQWKQKQKVEALEQKHNNHNIIKQAEYVKQIEKLQSQNLILKTQKNQLQNRIKMFERSLQIKGGQFAFYLKKSLQDDGDIDPTSKKNFQDMVALFTQVADRKDAKMKQVNNQGAKRIFNQSLNVISDLVPQISNDKQSKKKAAPILKKNIYGYYEDPQFAGNYTIGGSTKHPNNNKQTQTLSEDLCVLTLHPVMMVTLIDGNIKPQRTRHSNQYFVRIQVNESSTIESSTKQGMQPIWHEPYLLKDYDFPFIDVSLMHKSKGLRDYSLGNGKLSASSQQQKIVNIRKQKQFHGRVRFSVSYPKGNIYEFKITSVKLQIPSQLIVLKQQVSIYFPFNSYLFIDYSLPENIKYLDKTVIILDNSDESMQAIVTGAGRKGEVSLKQFVGKQGNKQIVVEVQDGWKVILQGEIYLLICQDVEPQRIQEDLLQGGKGKYFSVRAPSPIVSVTYSSITLYSSIKFPLVFNLLDEVNRLSILRELQNKQISQEIVEPLVNQSGFLKENEIIKAPAKIYKFFIETLQGEQVILKHQSCLFERLLKQIHLQISYKQDQIQEINYARKGKNLNADLFKEFTIQSKELMLNHYKVFSKHFKRIGFVKFKLGYTIYDNQLLTESLQQSQSKIQALQPLKQGLYFIELLLSEAHLTTKSSSSSYKCILSSVESKQMKGNNPKWNQSFILPFQLTENLQMEVKYQLWENGTFSKNRIYDGTIVVNSDVLRLGCLIVSLDLEKKDCLHFSCVRIPEELYRLSINEIQAEIKEQADWIGKIDPYIILQSQNRQLLRTQYLNDIGSHPIWKNIHRQMIVQSHGKENHEESSFLECSIYDYDLIGKNDFIGTAKINKKLNTELQENSKSEILYGNIIKQNLICGSLKIRGVFEKIHQPKIKIPDVKSPKLNRKDVVYNLSIFSLAIFKVNEWKGDNGVIIAKRGGKKIASACFSMDQSKLAEVFLSLWGTQAQQIEVQLIRQYKRFFKSYSDSLGIAVITIKSQQFNKGFMEIKLQDSTTATASFLCQPPNKIKYAQVKTPIYCKKGITIKSDVGDSLSIEQSSKRHLFYHKQFYFVLQEDEKEVRLQARQISLNVLGIYLPNHTHSTLICCVCIMAENILSTQFQQKSQRSKDSKYAQYLRLSYIHWQPYKYQSPSSYQFKLKSNKDKENITISEKLNQVYNDYLLLKQRQQSIVFEKEKIPDEIEVYNKQSQQRQAVISVNLQSKIFVSGKGALYYKLQEYNHKSVTKLSFQYLYIRLQNPQLLIGFKDIKLTIKSQLSYHTFQSYSIPNSSFLFLPFSMIISNSPNLSNIFFEAEISGTDDTSSKVIKNIKFGLRVQANKKQYRVVDNQEFVVHSLFQCESIVRNYEEKAPIDNTVYGLSFIQLEQLQLQMGEGSSKRRIYAQINLANQFEKIYLEKVGSTNVFKSSPLSKFFIERFCVVEIVIIQQGILSSCNIGKSVFKLTDSMLLKKNVTIQNELIASDKVVGRCKLNYRNLIDQQFLDVNLFNYICQDSVFGMNAEMREIGEGKLKYQKMGLTNKGNVQRLESDDSFIAINDPREYQITVNDRTTNKLFGEFKLFHETKIGEKIMALQPLRTATNNLNGVLIIEYEKKIAKGSALDETKNTQPLLLNLVVQKLMVKQHLQSQKEHYSFRLNTSMRQNKSKMQQLNYLNKQKGTYFTLFKNQFGEFTLLQKDNIIGSAKLNPPYFEGQERIIVLEKQSVSAICFIRFEYIKSQEIYGNMMEITSLQAANLKDTELFAKMNPYVEIKDLMRTSNPFITQLGIGKQSIFWKVGLLISKSLQFAIMDKDLIYDDFVGSAKLSLNNPLQKQSVFEITLIGQNQKQQKAGQLKVFASPIQYKFHSENVIKEGIQQVKCFLLKLGGFTMSIINLENADRLIIELIYREGTSLILYNEYFKADMFFYLASKDIEVQFDNYYSKQKNQNYEIRIRLSQKNNIVYQQLLNAITPQKPPLFSITTSLPLRKQFISFERVFLWFYKKISKKLQIYLATKNGFNRLNIVSYQKNFILIQPIQLSQLQYGEEAWVLLKQNEQTQYRLDLRVNKEYFGENKVILHDKIIKKNKQEVGYYFCEIIKCKSQGEQYSRKKFIGKSQKNWLKIQICQAILTKDLELFSKMDPYCQFKIDKTESSWRKTAIQNDIGLHPIWNETFLIDLNGNYGEEQMVFQVIDEEVTSDRMIGEGKATIKHLLKSQGQFSQIALLYKLNEPSGKLRVKTSVTNKYLIFRNIMNLGECAEPIIINEDNIARQKGSKIQLGQVYPIDASKQFNIKIGETAKNFTWQQIRKENCLVFDTEEIVLRYDVYE